MFLQCPALFTGIHGVDPTPFTSEDQPLGTKDLGSKERQVYDGICAIVNCLLMICFLQATSLVIHFLFVCPLFGAIVQKMFRLFRVQLFLSYLFVQVKLSQKQSGMS